MIFSIVVQGLTVRALVIERVVEIAPDVTKADDKRH